MARIGIAQTRMSSSPCSMPSQPSSAAAQRSQASAISASSSRRRQPVGHRLLGEGRRRRPAGPRVAPPLPLLRRGEAPGRRRRGERPRSPAACAHDEQPAAGVGLGAVAPAHPLVEVAASGRARRPPGTRSSARVVDVAHGDHAARPADPRHLAQRGDRVGQVLQHLVGVDDVERVVGHGRGRRRRRPRRSTSTPARSAAARASASGSAETSMPSTRPGRHPGGQVDGDRAGPAADVEQVHARAQRRQQVGRGVLRRPPAVRLQDGLGVPVGVRVHAGSPTPSSHPAEPCSRTVGRAQDSLGQHPLGHRHRARAVGRHQADAGAPVQQVRDASARPRAGRRTAAPPPSPAGPPPRGSGPSASTTGASVPYRATSRAGAVSPSQRRPRRRARPAAAAPVSRARASPGPAARRRRRRSPRPSRGRSSSFPPTTREDRSVPLQQVLAGEVGGRVAGAGPGGRGQHQRAVARRRRRRGPSRASGSASTWLTVSSSCCTSASRGTGSSSGTGPSTGSSVSPR